MQPGERRWCVGGSTLNLRHHGIVCFTFAMGRLNAHIANEDPERLARVLDAKHRVRVSHWWVHAWLMSACVPACRQSESTRRR